MFTLPSCVPYRLSTWHSDIASAVDAASEQMFRAYRLGNEVVGLCATSSASARPDAAASTRSTARARCRRPRTRISRSGYAQLHAPRNAVVDRARGI